MNEGILRISCQGKTVTDLVLAHEFRFSAKAEHREFLVGVVLLKDSTDLCDCTLVAIHSGASRPVETAFNVWIHV